jgi:hypothetical protein
MLQRIATRAGHPRDSENKYIRPFKLREERDERQGGILPLNPGTVSLRTPNRTPNWREKERECLFFLR